MTSRSDSTHYTYLTLLNIPLNFLHDLCFTRKKIAAGSTTYQLYVENAVLFRKKKIRKALISTPFRVCFVRHATPGTDPGVFFEETREIRKGRSKSVCRKFLLNPIFHTIKKRKSGVELKDRLKRVFR